MGFKGVHERNSRTYIGRPWQKGPVRLSDLVVVEKSCREEGKRRMGKKTTTTVAAAMGDASVFAGDGASSSSAAIDSSNIGFRVFHLPSFFFFGSLCTFLWFHRCHLFFCFFFSLSLFVVAQEVWVGGRYRPRRLSTGIPFLFPSNRNRGWCLLLDLELNCTGSTWFVVFCLSIFLGVFSHWEPKKIQSCFV